MENLLKKKGLTAMAQKQNNNQPTAMDNIKKGFEYAAALTSLKFKLGKAKCKRKDAYARLGELSYAKLRPRRSEVAEDIEEAIAKTVSEITELTHEIAELKIRVEILKADRK